MNTEMKHTPGPLVSVTFQVPQFEGDYQSTEEFSASDFPVFAAAPELLAALEEIVDGFGEAYPLRKARAAIAKARGEQS